MFYFAIYPSPLKAEWEIKNKSCNKFGAIQALRCGGGRVSTFTEKRITKVHGSMLLAFRGGGWVSIFQKKGLRNIWMTPFLRIEKIGQIRMRRLRF